MTTIVTPPVLATQIVAPLPGVLSGTTAIAGLPDAPVRRRVQIVEATSNAHDHVFPSVGAFVAWTWASDSGEWSFDRLNPASRYHVIAYDHTGQYDPVIKMNLVPTVD
jgi:hypothetical protein